MRRSISAFTLVETLVVTAAIGILTIILTISYSTYIAAAKTAASKANAGIAQEIAENFKSDNGSYPDIPGKLLLGSKSINMSKNINIIADADETTLNNTNGTNTVAFACLDSCDNKNISGARITYWDFSENKPRYIFLGNASASSSFGYPPVMTEIKSGDNLSCAITTTTSVYCWGFGGKGQYGNSIEGDVFASTPTSIYMDGQLKGKTIKQTTGGDEFICAIASDDKVYCWGNNSGGRLGIGTWDGESIPPTQISETGSLSGKTALSISSSASHTCIIASNNLGYCWGGNYSGAIGDGATSTRNIPVEVRTDGVLSGKTLKKISAGTNHTCAIASDNNAYCWGLNSNGELGNANTTNSPTPVQVLTSGALSGKTLLSISTGDGFTCAIASDNLPYCWGRNSFGELGDNTTVSKSSPVPVTVSGQLNNKTVKSISSSNSSSCVIASDDLIYCWGDNRWGQLGDGTYTSRSTPTAIYSGGYVNGFTSKSIEVGYYNSCAVSSVDTTYCWGSNQYGSLSQNETRENSNKPIPIPTDGAIKRLKTTSVNTGNFSSCITASDGRAYCWGRNNRGQLGNNISPNKSYPTKSIRGPLTNNSLNTLSVSNQICASNSIGIPYCWAENEHGESGTGNSKITTTPTPVDRSGILSGKTIKRFSTGLVSTCAIASDDLPYCWGYNAGNFGNNNTNSSYSPIQVYVSGVLSGKTVKDITSGNDFSCVIASDNKVYCWGESNYYGQLGNNTTNSTLVPVAVYTGGVMSGKNIAAISSGSNHACALDTAGQLYCWGSNSFGQLGIGNYDNKSQPTQIPLTGVLAGKTIKSVAAGYYSTCVLASDNLPYCWGYNGLGQLGNNSFSDSTVPVAVMLNDVLKNQSIKSLSSGKTHVCALTIESKAMCWGGGANGQLGNGAKKDSPFPVWVAF